MTVRRLFKTKVLYKRESLICNELYQEENKKGLLQNCR